VIRLPPSESPKLDPLQRQEAAEHRRRLLLHNRERIEFAYDKAQSDGIDDAVVLVLDLSDDRAARLAQLAGLHLEQIERWREECARREVVPTQILAAPRWAALTVVGPMTPNSALGIIQSSPPDTFRVVAIASGGNAFADFPMPPESPLDGT
jgi:hypothetical protein